MFRPSLATVLVVALLAALGLVAVAASQRARSQRAGARPATSQPGPARVAAVGRPLEPLSRVAPGQPGVAATRTGAAAQAPAAPAPRMQAAPKPGAAVLRVRAGHTLVLRTKPGGAVAARVGAATQFGSPTTLTVAAQHGGWLAVTSTNLPNGKLGWVRAQKGIVEQHRTRISIRVDLSARRLQLLDGRRVLRTARVGIGRPGSATPTGRFSITDKLAGSTYGPYYGCCILALSGHQGNTPAGWQGGDRLAIHGTDDPASIGVPSSAGCLHADAEDLRVLMRRVPLGTPVFIHG